MCGIVGLITKSTNGFSYAETELFEQMLLVDYLRGKDSTGAFGVLQNNQIIINKIASHPLDLFACGIWQEYKRKMIRSGHIMIGHNRKATGGKVTSENAHPFHENNIVLVHNGVIRSGVESAKSDEIEVDSHMVCKAFSENHFEEVVQKIHGAFAFIWYDKEKRRLFALRNEERPLFIVETTANLTGIASEPWMFSNMLQRDGKGHYLKEGGTKQLEVGKLYCFEKGGSYTTTDIKLASKTSTVVHTYTPNRAETRPPFNAQQMANTPRLLTSTPTNSAGANAPVYRQSSDEFRNLHDDPRNGQWPKEKDKVLVTFQSKKRIGTGNTWQLNGTIVSSYMQKFDVCLNSDWNPEPEEMFVNPRDANTALRIYEVSIATVVASTRGVTAYVHNPMIARTFTTGTGVQIPALELDWLCRNDKCGRCDAPMLPSEVNMSGYTFIRGMNKWNCSCADCMVEAIHDDTARNKMKNRLAVMRKARNDTQNSTVQDGIEVCELTLDMSSGQVTTQSEAAA